MWKLFTFLIVFSMGFTNKPTPSELSLNLLMEGNKRFSSGKAQVGDRSPTRRKEKITKQNPYAIIIACSDSRVSPEILFDAGIGDLFVIRLAGNVVSSIALESINYAVDHLKTPLILVMGHQNCGAVEAVVENQTQDIKKIAKQVEPAVRQAKKLNPSNLLENSIKINAINTKKFLLTTPSIAKKISDNSLAIYSAYYNFQTGKVELVN